MNPELQGSSGRAARISADGDTTVKLTLLHLIGKF
jgi:hypothetical protein